MDLVHRARSEDINNYDASFGRNPSQQGSTLRQRNAGTTPIAIYGGGASHIVKVQVEPIRRRAARGLIYGSEDEEVGKNPQARKPYPSTSRAMSFLIIGDAYIKGVTSSPGDHPTAVAAISTSAAPQSGFNSLLNSTNPTVELIACDQRFDGSFPVRNSFIALLTGSASAPPLPTEFTNITGSEQEKQSIWVTLLALAVLAKHLPEDKVTWIMLAEKAENFVRRSLVSLGVDGASVTPVVNGLKKAAAKYVSYKFWFPILKGSDSSVIILVVSIDG